MIQQRQFRRLLDSAVARWLAVAVWMTLIFGLSAQPQLPALPEPLLDVLFKKAGHFAAYAVLAALLWRALAPIHRVWLTAWLLATLYACSDEWHQSFVPGRHPSMWDVLIDSCGAAAALLLIWFSLRQTRFKTGDSGSLPPESPYPPL